MDIINQSVQQKQESRGTHNDGQRTYTTITAAANDFLATVLESERLLVSAGWWRPKELCNVGHLHALACDSFADPRLGFLYGYICSVAARDRIPQERECLGIAKRSGDVDLDQWDKQWLIRLITDFDAIPNRIDEYAAEVARLFKARETTARQALAKFMRTFIDPNHFTITIKPKHCRRAAGTIRRIPKRYSRKGYHAA